MFYYYRDAQQTNHRLNRLMHQAENERRAKIGKNVSGNRFAANLSLLGFNHRVSRVWFGALNKLGQSTNARRSASAKIA